MLTFVKKLRDEVYIYIYNIYIYIYNIYIYISIIYIYIYTIYIYIYNIYIYYIYIYYTRWLFTAWHYGITISTSWLSLDLSQTTRRGLLRLGPFKELPTHFHPESFGEIYHFTRGNGHVKLNEYTPNLVKHEISVGLHVSWRKLETFSIFMHFLFFWCNGRIVNIWPLGFDIMFFFVKDSLIYFNASRYLKLIR